MHNLESKIIKKCELKEIKTVYNEDTGRYLIRGLAHGDSTELFIENDNTIVFENCYGEQEHVLSFRDFVNTAHFWKAKYKDRVNWQTESPAWDLIFKEFIGGYNYHGGLEEEDLPF